MNRQFVSGQLRQSIGPIKILLALLIIALPITIGAVGLDNVALRDNLDVYDRMMTSPLGFVLPLVAVFVGCLGFYQQIRHRFVSYSRIRVDVKEYVTAQYILGAVWGFALFFLLAFLAFIIAFYIWPLLGNPGIDSGAYYLTPTQAVQQSYERSSYTSLLRLGSFTYGLTYSMWFGLSGAMYAMLGTAALLLFRNGILALASPFLLYLIETILASLLGWPEGGLLYSLLPFGLSQAPILVAALPTLTLGVLTAFIMWRTIRAAPLIENLA